MVQEEGMIFKAIIHDAEEGGYWAEVPALPGCVTQGETLAELQDNLREAILGCLAVLNERTGSPERVRKVVEVTV
jgi:predicted RNase H-like HicB family nuclease